MIPVERLEKYQEIFECLRRECHMDGDHMGQAAMEFALEQIRLVQSANESTVKDAARYRWLRENADEVFAGEAVEWQVKYGRLPAQLDDDIDAAMGASPDRSGAAK